MLIYCAVSPEIPRLIPPSEYAQIKKLVSEQVPKYRSPLFSDFSWRSLRQFPAAVRERLAGGILSVDVATNPPAVHLRVSGPKGRLTYVLQKRANEWQIVSERSWPKQ
jgi:hypothetical protein